MKIPGETQKNTVASKRIAENTGKAVQSSVALVKQISSTAKPAAIPVKTGTNLTNLLSALKLPQDNLSRSIVAFARFFSLPLEPKSLNSLRKDVLSLSGKGMTLREAAVLGSAAAADKGIKLDKKALSEYAAVIEGSLKSFTGKGTEGPELNLQVKDREGGEQHQDNPPDPEDEGTSPDNENMQENGHRHEGKGNDSGSFRDSNPGGQSNRYPLDRKDKYLKDQLSGDRLKHQVTKILNERPLLDLINRISGKKGRWIVIPFIFNQKDFEFNVSLRMLLYDNNLSPAESVIIERLTADIGIKRISGNITDLVEGEKQKRWFISLEKPRSALVNEAFLSGCRLSVFSETAAHSPSEKKRLKRDLAKALNITLDRVEIIEKPLLFADSRDDHLRSVDEEV